MFTTKKSSFALFFGNRGFFPASHQATARREMTAVLERLGHRVLLMDESATRYGAVETPAEGLKYAQFLHQHAGEYDGVILCLPNFGDETGATAALQDAGVPILIQAYPDELNKMGPSHRRDAFCGKFSVMDVFHQYGMKFTVLPPHVVAPSSASFARQVDYFDRLCRVVRGMRRMVVGAIGARTTAFKTVRIDELALQRHGITMETIDLSDLFLRVEKMNSSDSAVKAMRQELADYTNWGNVPQQPIDTMARMGVAITQIVDEFHLDALAVRCWIEMQKKLGISVCTLLSLFNNTRFAAACEVDVGSAVTMHALRLASGGTATCLDWNNNYGDDPDKCILFHCGPVPRDMMSAKGHVTDHSILATALQPGVSWGCNVGRIAAGDCTFGNLLTEDGKLKFYLGEGRFTADVIADDFFGCAGVIEVKNLQQALLTMGKAGHRHHVALTPGHIVASVAEAFENYLSYEVTRV